MAFYRVRRFVLTTICVSVVFLTAQPAHTSSLAEAFPGAEGFGAKANGWKNGSVHWVTNLNDNGPGSLRDCAQGARKTSAPRVCVFAVGGTIDLQNPIMVSSNMYIAGQTAPGDGIQLRIVDGGNGPIVVKNATDVVIRFLKVRPGASPEPSPNVDAITLENATNIYLGNLSMAFATDETFNIHVSGSTASDITLADSILALSLDRSNHPKGRHSKGALICSDEKPENQCGRVSLLRNLFAHHRDRMPDIKATDIGPVEVINNVFYNPISQFGEFYDLLGNARIAYVGNVALKGPSTIRKSPEAVQVFEWEDLFEVTLLAEDNIATTAEGCRTRRVEVLDAVASSRRISPPGWPLTIEPLPAKEVLDLVLETAGDFVPGQRQRDRLDQQVVEDVRSCTGLVIDKVEQVDGWPVLKEVAASSVPDTDGDGLPDSWEAKSKDLDPNVPDDPWSLNNETGLSHLETWLAVLAKDIEPSEAAN